METRRSFLALPICPRRDSSVRARMIVTELTFAVGHERETINPPDAKRKPISSIFSLFPLFRPVRFSFLLFSLLHHIRLAELAADDGELAHVHQGVIGGQ